MKSWNQWKSFQQDAAADFVSHKPRPPAAQRLTIFATRKTELRRTSPLFSQAEYSDIC
jgi:hypothetical protein